MHFSAMQVQAPSPQLQHPKKSSENDLEAKPDQIAKYF